MTHIEFIGPPGAGKSTLHRKLMQRNEIFGGEGEDAIHRQVISQEHVFHTIPYRLLPDSLQGIVDDHLLKYRYRYFAFNAFVNNHPEALSVIDDLLHSVDVEQGQAFLQIKKIMETYELGMQTIGDDELLCLDEGFAMGAVACAYRGGFPQIDTYFTHVPAPAILIHVDAPDQYCIERQQQRNRLVTDSEFVTDVEAGQARFREMCAQIVDEMTGHSHIIHVDTTTDIDTSITEIVSKLRT